MDTPKFKVGDKVRRKPDKQQGLWPHGDKEFTVEAFTRNDFSLLLNGGEEWDTENFDLVCDAAVAPTIGYPDDNPKTAMGLAKPSFAPIPPVGILHLGRAMADGRKKYGLMNWREKTISSSVYYDAAMRHLMSWWDGEDVAQDSGVHHLGHAMACMALILDSESTGKLNDDRPTKGMFADIVAALTVKK